VQVKPDEERCIWGGFLSLAIYSPCILRNLTAVTKDGSDIVAYYHPGIYDNFEFFIGYTRRSGGLQARARGTISVFTAGFDVSLPGAGEGFHSRHLLNL